MKPKERLECALRRQIPDRVPTFEWFIDPGVGENLTGSRDLLDIVEGLNLDGVNVRPDYARERLGDTSFRDEWGCVREETGDVLPAVTRTPIEDIANGQDFRFPDPEAPGRFRSLERAVARLGDERAVVLNVRDGFSDLRDLLGYENALMALMTEPDQCKALLDRVVDYNVALAQVARERCGVQIVATTDDVAYPSGLLVRPAIYHEVLAPAFRRAMEGFKTEGFLCIKHSDGDVSVLIEFWIDAGIDCLDPIDPAGGLDLGAVKRAYGQRICLKGNVDCSGVLCTGSQEEIEKAVVDCLQAAAAGGGYILSSSNTIHRGVKPENFRAMLEALWKHGEYANGAAGLAWS
jgi:uroporphyrinogen decarboxylase